MSAGGRETGPTEAVFASLLARARNGEGAAWEQLYRWLAPGIAGYLRVQHAHEPEDLTSEVFLALVKSVGTFRGGPSAFRSFAFVIAHRRLQDERRRAVRQRPPEPTASFDNSRLPASGDTSDAAMTRVAGERVLALCDHLSPDQRDVVLLRVVADLSLEEVASVLGKTTGAVKGLQHRAFAQIRRQISQEAVSP